MRTIEGGRRSIVATELGIAMGKGAALTMALTLSIQYAYPRFEQFLSHHDRFDSRTKYIQRD